jgi:hypothetical protein
VPGHGRIRRIRTKTRGRQSDRMQINVVMFFLGGCRKNRPVYPLVTHRYCCMQPGQAAENNELNNMVSKKRQTANQAMWSQRTRLPQGEKTPRLIMYGIREAHPKEVHNTTGRAATTSERTFVPCPIWELFHYQTTLFPELDMGMTSSQVAVVRCVCFLVVTDTKIDFHPL